jgi:hypothetical protein
VRRKVAIQGLSADERQGQRKAPLRKANVSMTQLELLGGSAIGIDEFRIGFSEPLAPGFAGGVAKRRRRFLREGGPGGSLRLSAT